MGKGRAPCCDKTKVNRGPWSPAEDTKLTTFIQQHGHPNWRALPAQAGLLRCGKSCRLRWINYLRPDVRRGNFTPKEEEDIIKLHETYGNKWSKIASFLPGRTDNEIKNIWNTHLKKRLGIKSSKRNNKKAKSHKPSNDFVVESSSPKHSFFSSSNDEVDRDSKVTTSHDKIPGLQGFQTSPMDDRPKESPSPSLISCVSNISTKDQNRSQMDLEFDIPLEEMGVDDLGALDELGFDLPFEFDDSNFWNNVAFNSLCSVETGKIGYQQFKALEESSSVGLEDEHNMTSEVISRNWVRNLEIELGLDDIQ